MGIFFLTFSRYDIRVSLRGLQQQIINNCNNDTVSSGGGGGFAGGLLGGYSKQTIVIMQRMELLSMLKLESNTSI